MNRISICQDWKYVPIDSIALKGPQNGLYKPQDNYGSGLEMVHMQDLFSKTVISSGGMSRVKITEKELNNFKLEEGDILFARRSIAVEGSGKSSIVGTLSEPTTFESSIIRITFDKKKVSPKFISYYLQSPIGKHEMKCITRVVTISGITGEDLKKYKVPVPVIKEQEGIVIKLETWDQSISLVEDLITAKQDHRKWLMQQLLTGKRRLPGFDKAWEIVHLGDVFTNRVETNRPDLPLVAITGSGGIVGRDELNRRDTSSEDKSKYLRICPGDIGYNTMRMWQGVCGLSQLEGIVSPAYTIVTPKDNIDGEFMALLFKSLPVIHLFHRHSQGLVDDTLNLKWHHFSEIKVTIPDKPEQQAIASVFRIADRELDLLRAQLDALREQKKGLMQQLLTGKRRVTIQ